MLSLRASSAGRGRRNAVFVVIVTGVLFAFTGIDSASLATAVQLAPSDDSYVDSSDSGGNHGWRDYMIAGEWDLGSPYRKCRVYLKFELGAIPLGQTITSATLHLNCATRYDPPVQVGAHNMTPDNWQEWTITWNNAPTGFAATATSTTTLVNGFNSWSVTSDVQSAYAGDGIYSVVMRVPSEGTSAKGGWFDTKEFSNSANHPYLEVEYGPAGVDYIDLDPIDDSYVDDADGGGNHGWRNYMIVGEWDVASPYRICRSYLKFDLSAIPVGQTIVSSDLYLNCSTVISSPVLVGAHYMTIDAWQEYTITWNNAPTTFNPVATSTVSVIGTFNTWPVGPDVQHAYSTDGFYSVVMRITNEGSSTKGAWVDPKEVAAAANRPYLHVGYSPLGSGDCDSDDDCDDGDDCYDYCDPEDPTAGDNGCVMDSGTYADVNGDGFADIDDTLATLACFGGDCAECAGGVVEGCDVTPCDGDGFSDIDDTLATLAAFGGDYWCDCG